MTQEDWLRLSADTQRHLTEALLENVLLRLLVDTGIRERAALQKRCQRQQEQIRELMQIQEDTDGEDT